MLQNPFQCSPLELARELNLSSIPGLDKRCRESKLGRSKIECVGKIKKNRERWMRKKRLSRISGMMLALQKFYYKVYCENILSRALILCRECIGLC